MVRNMEEILSYGCKCGGKLKSSQTEIEFFGIEFGLKPCEVCTKCGAEYIDQQVMKEIEKEVKKRGILGLERNIQVTKSGNSLVIRIPPEVAKFLNIRYKTLLRLFPVDKKRIEVEVIGV